MAVKFDPPWRLDPLKNIVGVGWGGSTIVLSFNYSLTTTGNATSPPNWTASFTSDGGGGLLTEAIGPIIDPPGPPEGDVTSKNNFWCYQPVRNLSSETHTATFHVTDIGIYGVICSGGVIPSFTDAFGSVKVPFIVDSTISGLFNTGGMDVYGIKDNPSVSNALTVMMNSVASQVFGIGVLGSVSSYLQEEQQGHDEIGSSTTYALDGRTITFINLPRISKNSPDVKASNKFTLVATMQGATSSQFLTWSVSIAAYLGTKKFNEFGNPVDGRDPIDANGAASDIHQELVSPPVEVTLTVDLTTYKVTASKRDLT